MKGIEDQWKMQPSPTKDIKLSNCWEATQIFVIVRIYWNILQYKEMLVKDDEFKFELR